MNSRVITVFRGFLSLTAQERAQLVEALNNYVRADDRGKRSVEIEVRKAILGPVSSGCPCCGR